MKILLVSRPVNHFFNWALQLEHSGHELYWFDIGAENTYFEQIAFVNQIVFWKRKIDYPGRYWLKKNLRTLYNLIEKFNKNKFEIEFRKKLKEIKPDVVHSFEMHLASIPILEFMKCNPNISWIHSSWGSDIFAFQDKDEKVEKIRSALNRLDYMFADCQRDFKLAKKFGFKGKELGVFPGSGGFDFKNYNPLIKSLEQRKLILVKGYESEYGRAISVLKALLENEDDLKDLEIIVFGATAKVKEFVLENRLSEKLKISVLGRVDREVVMELMGKSLLYIGNSISDGMPNTLLEAIIMEVFPIQSNPGGATAEIIEHGKNGLLIDNPEDVSEISVHITKALANPALLHSGILYNTQYIKPLLEKEHIRKRVLEKYNFVEAQI